ncbi:MAG TPA: O-methyltransferase [Acidimicrobiales bacterium]|nr:O-methyltransferase [Acidimicrobiales bacterium]
MTRAQWAEVDDYVMDRLIGPDVDLDAALADSEKAGLPAIAVSGPQGKLLHLLARSVGARRILEVGTLGGYSTIWLARALPEDGRLVTLEIDGDHARVARANLDRAGVVGRVEIRLGPALETMAALALEGEEPFDLVFIDADKENIPAYFDWAVKLSRSGGVIITDNVVRDGALVDAGTTDPRVLGVRAFHEMLSSRPDVEATTIQTVGAKGYDGFNVAVVN